MIKNVIAEVYDSEKIYKGKMPGKFKTDDLYFVSKDEEYQIAPGIYAGDKFVKTRDLFKIDGKWYRVKEVIYSKPSTWRIQLRIAS